MKKALVILMSLMVGASVFAQNGLKFETNGSETRVENFTAKKRYAARDNINFVNSTDKLIHFKVYGKKDADSKKEFICMLQVGRNGSTLKKLSTKLKNYKFVEFECGNGVPVFESIDVLKNNMTLYISDFKQDPIIKKAGSNDR